jgi:aryl-phospho-beta-D-glucosidase BglC (GH1 family)
MHCRMPMLHVRPLSLVCLLPLLVACAQGEGERSAPAFDLATVMTELPAEPIVDHLLFEETPVGKHGRLHVQGADLVDENGSPVQLKGISSMWLNMEGTGYAHSAASMKWMRDNWGITVFRAAMGVGDDQGNASGGGYLVNPTRMMTIVERIVENATKLGIYVIIDWHDHIAQDHVDEAEAFFSEMALRYRDHENVMYEVFNEPIPGIRNRQTREVTRSFTWEGDIKPYHERLVEVIRAKDPEGIVILGTPMWSQEVDKAAADPVVGTNLMYTLHFYTCTHTGWLRERAEAARLAGLPMFVTEWGATDASGGTGSNTEVCVDESNLWQDWMNEHSISWAAWKLDDCSDISCLLKTGTPVGADWSTRLHGHGSHIVEKLLTPSGAPPPVPVEPSDADGGAPPSSSNGADAAVPSNSADAAR